MWAVRMAAVVATAVAVSGCAGSRQVGELKRLQSQVTLLDDRVSQLERGSVNWSSSATMHEPIAESAPVISELSAKAAAPSIGADLSTKPTTRQIQQALKNAGFYQGAVDGKMGPLTREAIREFQRVQGLKDDGLVGRQTWTKLSAYADLSASSGELSAAEILK